jgi:signal peptidase complex subunit 1
MDALLDQARDIYEGEIVSSTPPFTNPISRLTPLPQDFRGQSLSDTLTTFLLVASSIIAVLVGFTTQDIYKTLYIGLSGTALTFLLTVPQWPFYNKKPEPWLPARVPKASAARNVDLGGVQIEVDGKRVG